MAFLLDIPVMNTGLEYPRPLTTKDEMLSSEWLVAGDDLVSGSRHAGTGGCGDIERRKAPRKHVVTPQSTARLSQRTAPVPDDAIPRRELKVDKGGGRARSVASRARTVPSVR
jgi:hypothetical protein